MPLPFNFEEELEREAARAISENNEKHKAIGLQKMLDFADRCLVNSEIKDDVPSPMKLDLYWSSMIALAFFEEKAEKSEKVTEDERPTFVLENPEVKEGHKVTIRFHLDCGELSLKCTTVIPGKEDQKHTVSLQTSSETSENK
jgi:hypothetical protein